MFVKTYLGTKKAFTNNMFSQFVLFPQDNAMDNNFLNFSLRNFLLSCKYLLSSQFFSIQNIGRDYKTNIICMQMKGVLYYQQIITKWNVNMYTVVRLDIKVYCVHIIEHLNNNYLF